MGEVWISRVRSNTLLGNKVGVRVKYPEMEWTPAQHILPSPTEESLSRLRHYESGYRLSLADSPEALAVWDPKCFSAARDMFSIGLYVVKPKLAAVFSQFDLGEGGLTPLPVYEADLTTPVTDQYWLLHFGSRKNTFLPEQSNQEDFRIRSGGVARSSGVGYTAGIRYWKTSSLIADYDVAVSSEAIRGSDLWIEELIPGAVFMSGRLVEALNGVKSRGKVDFRLNRCRVVGS